MATQKPADEFRREFPLWYYERSPEACLRAARVEGRRRRLDVDREPKVRVRGGKVALIWSQRQEQLAL